MPDSTQDVFVSQVPTEDLEKFDRIVSQVYGSMNARSTAIKALIRAVNNNVITLNTATVPKENVQEKPHRKS